MFQNYFKDGNLSTMKKQTPSTNSRPLQSWTVHQPKSAVLSADIRQCSACTASWHRLSLYLCCNLASTISRPLQSWTTYQPRSAVLSAEIRQCSACTASWHRLSFYLCFNFASTQLTNLSLHCQLPLAKLLPLLQHRFSQRPTSTLHGETTEEESNF